MTMDDTSTRKRRAHTKSRQGCGNCKLRRVKCDEAKPRCSKCTSFGVACDYESKASDLQVSGVGSFQLEVPKPPTPPATPETDMDQFIYEMMDTPLELHIDDGVEGVNVCYIDKPHLDLLRKFYHRSALSIGTAESVHVYRDILTRMAAQHSCTLHAVLRFTLMHDRYLYDPLGTKPSAAEAFHGYHAAALFSKKLTGTLKEEEKDAMWGCAALLGASSFASFDGTTPQESWPLKLPGLDDLDWLKMSDGKKAVWILANPMRETSAFKPAIDVEHNKRREEGPRVPSHPELDRLFPFVTKLYNLDSPRTPESPKDPYYTAASIVERLVPLECNHSTIMWFLSFIGHMDPEYRQLLEEKDPAAMILLAWWYAKVIPYGAWWITRRGWFETQAICIYLDQSLPPDHEIRRLLEFPRSVCSQYGPYPPKFKSSAVGINFPWQQNFWSV